MGTITFVQPPLTCTHLQRHLTLANCTSGPLFVEVYQGRVRVGVRLMVTMIKVCEFSHAVYVSAAFVLGTVRQTSGHLDSIFSSINSHMDINDLC